METLRSTKSQSKNLFCLENVDFQDFLLENKVMSHREKEALTNTNQHLYPSEIKLLRLLRLNRNYIVPYTHIYKNLYDKPLKPNSFRVYLNRLRDKLIDPSSLNVFNGHGVSINVDRLPISPEPLKILFYIWENNELQTTNLCKLLYGTTDKYSENVVRNNIHRLRQNLQSTNLRIKTEKTRHRFAYNEYILLENS